MANERNTENIVRDTLRELGYYGVPEITVEEQRSKIENFNKLLKSASKSGKGGAGAPEFLITTSKDSDFVILFECKASTKYHESPKRTMPKDFAVDGVLHYAKFLSKDYTVIAVAVSGETPSELKISNFVWAKGASEYRELTNTYGQQLTEIVPYEDYIRFASFDVSVQKMRHDDLMAFSRELHNFMRDHAKLTEAEKPLLVSGTLIALRNKGFAVSYSTYSASELQRQWLRAIEDEIEGADIPYSKKENMLQPYSTLAVHPILGERTSRFPRGVLSELISMLNEHVWPFISIYHDYDIVGQFYGEFLKYTGGDKKALGIVLTPRHVTELFAELANVSKTSRVYDPCCGTGGFLISAMQKMLKDAQTDFEIEQIKKHGLYGVEQQPGMYALAASNMILRGDGKANLYQGSCFNETIESDIIGFACDVGMINPPYSQKDEESRELVFVREMLKVLKKGAMGIAIVPMSCAITPHPIREELLKHHTLEAVMSMPDELFYPVGTVTCIMIFKAHIPHAESNQKTWFGYWKNDGFIKTKNLGRIDQNHTWKTISKRWIEAYRNKDDVPGESVKAYVTAADEWCAEAYMETDYSTITAKDFANEVKKYAMYSAIVDED